MKEDEVGWACGMRWRDENSVANFGFKTCRVDITFRISHTYGDNIKKHLEGIECEILGWIDVADVSVQWRTFV